MTPSIYLAGPVKEAADSGAGWREQVKQHWPEPDWIDPLEKYSPGDGQLPDAFDIVDADIELITDVDAVLVKYDGQPTWGTPMEVYYAFSVLDTPVAIAWTASSDLSPWAEYHSHIVRPSIDKTIDALREYMTGVSVAHLAGVRRYNAAEDIDELSATIEEMTASATEVIEEAWEGAERSDQAGGDDGVMPSGDEMAAMVADDVSELLTDSRDTHGDAVENQQHIASGWDWYLRGQGYLSDNATIDGTDVARMMMLVKASRSAIGTFDVDHDRDIAGYAAIAAACAVDRGAASIDELQEFATDGGGE